MWSFWEEMIINAALGVIRTTVKNPKSAAAARGVLLRVADDIYMDYGLTPPSHD